jgi:hypothetical protein
MEKDRPTIDKTTKYFNQIGSVFEPAGYKKKSKTKEYTEKNIGKG